VTESSERSLRAEGRGKRLRFTRRRRLRAGREATLRSDEHRATGAASGGAAPKRRAPGNRGGERRGTSFEAPSRRLAGGHGQRGSGRSTGAPQLHPRNHRSGGATKRVTSQLERVDGPYRLKPVSKRPVRDFEARMGALCRSGPLNALGEQDKAVTGYIHSGGRDFTRKGSNRRRRATGDDGETLSGSALQSPRGARSTR
jgi:hypothetical protein